MQVNIAVAIRTGRVAIGWTQNEFAVYMGVAKSTIARIETAVMAPKADFLVKALNLFKQVGVDIDINDKDIVLKIKPLALDMAKARLNDVSFKRSDFKKEK